jgi:hypothetical protein
MVGWRDVGGVAVRLRTLVQAVGHLVVLLVISMFLAGAIPAFAFLVLLGSVS